MLGLVQCSWCVNVIVGAAIGACGIVLISLLGLLGYAAWLTVRGRRAAKRLQIQRIEVES